MKNNLIKLLVLAVAVMSVLLALASCGCSHEAEDIPAVESTCTTAGATAGSKCKLCGEILTAPTEISVLPHSPANAQKKNPTCTEDGHEAGVKCSVCEAVISGMNKIPAAHKPVDVAAKEPTCTADGHAAGTRCSVCAEDLSGLEVVAKIPHELKDIAKIEPKCTEAGSEAGKVCDYGCGYTEGLAAIAPVGHTPVDVEAKPATCTEDGHEAGKRCSVCGSATEGCNPIPAAGHNVPSWTMEIVPAYNVEGKRTGKCTVCSTDVVDVYAPFTGYTFDAPDATAPSVGGSHLTSSLVDRDNGKAFFMSAARTVENAFNGSNRINGNWTSALSFDKADALAGFTVSYDVMVPSRDADGDGVSNEYIGDFFANGGNPRLYQIALRTNAKNFMAYTYIRMACSAAENPFATGQADGVIADGWYLTFASTSGNADEVVFLGEDMQALALDTWYTITYEVDTATGVIEVFINGAHAYNVYSAIDGAIHVEEGRTTYTSPVAYVAGDQIDVRIGDLARAIGGISFDNIIFAPYTLEHTHAEKHDFAPVDGIPAKSCVEAGITAGVKCTVCGLVYSGCESVIAGHVAGADVVVVEQPTADADGRATGTCAVCNQPAEFVIPKLVSATWDYEASGLTLTNNKDHTTVTTTKDGDNTYATVTTLNDSTSGSEAHLRWAADGLAKMQEGVYFHLSTEIMFGRIVAGWKDGNEASGLYNNNWMMSLRIADQMDQTDDDDCYGINFNFSISNTETNECNANIGSNENKVVFETGKWYTIDMVFTMNAEGKAYYDLYVDGKLVGSSDPAALKANFVDEVAGIVLKFKNTRNFKEWNVSFDNTSITQSTVAPVIAPETAPAE